MYKVIVIVIVILIVIFISIKSSETFINYKYPYYNTKYIPEKLKSWLPEKIFLDSHSANNILTFTNNNICNEKNNVNCGLNPQYLHNMCLQRRYNNKKRLCNSIVDVVPRPQNISNPKNFYEF